MVTENKNNLTFENALKELESIAEKLSEGNLLLEESIELFEKGMKLKKFCAERLEKAAEKIKILIKDQGEFQEEDFEIE